MKIHAASSDKNKAEKLAKELGLDQIPDDARFAVHKTSAKKPSRWGIPDMGEIERGTVIVVGSKDAVALYISNPNTWFVTSAIQSCKKVGNDFELETRNSFYKLVNLDRISN